MARRTHKDGWVVWLTGLPGSGKSSIARVLARRTGARVLSVDAVRKLLTPRPTYSERERERVYSVLTAMAALLAAAGQSVVVDATANRRRYRDRARRLAPRFAEVYVRCALETAIARERGRGTRIYRKGRKNVPGVTTPYEPPRRPEVVVDTELLSPSEGARKVLAFLRAEGNV